MVISDLRKGMQLFSAIYASPIERIIRKLWTALKNISPINKLPWMLAKDFNDISDMREKYGGVCHNISLVLEINDWIKDPGMIDLGAIGPKFTWCSG